MVEILGSASYTPHYNTYVTPRRSRVQRPQRINQKSLTTPQQEGVARVESDALPEFENSFQWMLGGYL